MIICKLNNKSKLRIIFLITKGDLDGDSKKYLLVMEYANGGTLRNYLKENFDNLTWNNKLNLALQLTYTISCLHDEGIAHGDLVTLW